MTQPRDRLGSPTLGPEPDPVTAAWLVRLRSSGSELAQAQADLHALLLSVARSELRRRNHSWRLAGPELDDVAHQAAADAMLAVTAKLDQFRGESRFTTWAYKFAVLEVSSKLGRHYWRRPAVSLRTEDWEQLPDRFGIDPAEHAEWAVLVEDLRTAVNQDLTERQRELFVAIVVDGVPLDALVVRLQTSRGAIYKMMFDARRKIRASLLAQGHLGQTDQAAAAAEQAEGRAT